jgi:hypothetical protein
MVLQAPHCIDIPPVVDNERGLVWYDARALGVGGKGWEDTACFYDRLPARAEGMIPEGPWTQSRDAAGLYVGFETDATEIHARWTVSDDVLEEGRMCRLGVSGLDLYAADDAGRWRWLGFGCPTGVETDDACLAKNIPAGRRRYLVYLPLRSGVESLAFGVPPGAGMEGIVPFSGKPIAYYGTSIVHGYGASRPGMCHCAQLGRRLNRPMLNLGLAGMGKMDMGMAELLGELDPAVYVIDCLPNMAAEMVTERAEPFLRRLRAARPATPIVLVEDRSCAGSWLFPAMRQRHLTSRAALRTAYEGLLADGVGELYYLPGEDLLGDDSDATVDNSHPNDLGYYRMVEALYPVIRSLI